MGLLAPVADFFCQEHKYRPIGGDCLFIGRQTTYLTEKSLEALLHLYGLKNEATMPPEFDEQTVGAKGRHVITDRYFMAALGVRNLNFLDISDYEGADIIHDLGYPIPNGLRQKFDFIYNGGCFDNMFSPGVAMVNLSAMLKPGGRVICLESISSFNNPYLMFSPAWFYDFYLCNDYADCKVYLASYQASELFHGPWELRYCNCDRKRSGPAPRPGHDHLLLLTIAEKGPNSTDEVQPVQWLYLHDEKERVRLNAISGRMQQGPRPLFGSPPDRETITRHYLNRVGRIGPDRRMNLGREIGSILKRRP